MNPDGETEKSREMSPDGEAEDKPGQSEREDENHVRGKEAAGGNRLQGGECRAFKPAVR